MTSTKGFQNQPVLQMYLEVVKEIYGININIGISSNLKLENTSESVMNEGT